MLQFGLFGIPVQIQPMFWLSAFLLGGGLSMQGPKGWIPVFIWTVAMLVSVLVHEMGHAGASRMFGGRPAVVLHGLGGVTSLGLGEVGRWRHLWISAAGPAAGLGLAAGVALLAWMTHGRSPVLDAWVVDMLWINVVWSLFNLLPILPMDGGQILRDLVGMKHHRACCILGGVLAVLLGVWAVLSGQYVLAIITLLLAMGNFKGSTQLEGGVHR
ncbi:MAG: site-2 protease family protein [Candidatus Methylacidiphilales bacterium]|nr:site-2 protease family protein [Candidatus Methylacidiphilales bacterium]